MLDIGSVIMIINYDTPYTNKSHDVLSTTYIHSLLM